MQKLGARIVTGDMCQYGRQYNKFVKFLVWGPAFEGLELKRCSPHNCICSRTHRRHIVLSGAHAGQFRSAAAQVYSKQVCDHIAGQLYKNATPPGPSRSISTKSWKTGVVVTGLIRCKILVACMPQTRQLFVPVARKSSHGLGDSGCSTGYYFVPTNDK